MPVPATCIVTGTVLDGGSAPIPGAIVRIRTVAPTTSTVYGFTSQDLTVVTDISGNWALTVTQGLAAQIDIPAIGWAYDITIPALTTQPITSITLFARGTLTPATILSTTGPAMGGDLTGTSPNPSVVGLRGKPLQAGAPANNQAYVYNSGAGAFTLQTITPGLTVQSVTAGTGIAVTGTAQNPIVGIAAGGVTATQLGSGAAATNVGTLGGQLSGTLPNPFIGVGVINDVNVSLAAAIAWTKINKSGAVAGDVGAIAIGAAILAITAGTGLSSTGTTSPTLSIANGGVTNTQLAAGAAAANIGTLGGALAGTIPNPTNTPNFIVNADINSAAAIAWTKISKAGAVPGDVGAENPSNKNVAGGYCGLDGGGKIPLANFASPYPPLHASTHATGGSDPITAASITAANLIHSHVESDVTGLVSDLADKLSKSAGGTVAGNVTFNGTTTIAGPLVFSGSFTPSGNIVVARIGDATVGAQQKNSNVLVLEASVWNVGSSLPERRLVSWRNTPTALNAGKMSLLAYSTDNVIGAEVSFFDAISGAFNGAVVGNVTGNVTGNLTGNVTGNASGTAGSITGALTGDVTSAGMATTVALVGGQTAANVAAGAVLANASTAANTFSAIVRRDGSGNFTATTITANLTGNATGFTGSLGGDVTGTQGATVVGKLQGRAVSATAPTNGQVLVWVTGNNDWEPGSGSTITSVNASGGSTGLSFTGGPITTGAGTLTLTGTLAIANGGTGQSSVAAAFNALSPMTTLGDVLYGGASGAGTRLAGNTATNRQFLTSAGSGGLATAPTFSLLVSGDIPNNAANTTGTALNVTGLVALANGGTGQTTAAAAFNALSPLTTLGDLLYGGASGAGTRLAGNTTTTRQFLTSLGSAGLATAPTLSALVAGDIPSLDTSILTTGILSVARGGSGAGTLTGFLKGNGAAAFTTVSSITLTTDVTGILPVANGGSGAATLTGFLVGNGTSAFTTKAAIVLTTDVSGTLPVANGGSGAVTLTGLLRGNGVSAITGSAQASLTTEVTGVLPYANGGTNASTVWTPGAILVVGASTLVQDAANLFYDTTNHLLGLGGIPTTNGAVSQLYVNGSSIVDAYAADPTRLFRRAAGTSGSPTAVQAAQKLALFDVRGRGATVYATARRAGLYAVTTEIWSDTAQGTAWEFETTAATTTTTAVQWHIDSVGAGFAGVTAPQVSIDTAGALQARGMSAPAVATSGNGRIYFDSTSKKWRVSQDTGAYVDLVGASGVTGNGTAGQLAYWASGTGLTGSNVLFLNVGSGFLGINQAVPTRTLDIAGTMLLEPAAAPGSPTNGDMWTDSTRQCFMSRQSGATVALTGTLFTQTNTVTVVSTTTPTSLVGSGIGTMTLPANFWTVSKTIEISLRGYIPVAVVTAPAWSFVIKHGSVTLATISSTVPIYPDQGASWEINFTLTCRSTGAAGTVFGQGTVRIGAETTRMLAMTTAATVDTTASALIDILATPGSNTTDSVACTNAVMKTAN